MANAPAGQYYLNGKDLFLIFGVMLEKGSTNDFLKYPDKKDSIEHDWQDANGIDVDLSRIFVKQKEINIKCLMIGVSTEDFWNKYRYFFAEWLTPGLKRFTVSEFDQSFFVYYKSSSEPKRFTRIKNTTKIIFEFSLNIIEQEPANIRDVFIVDEQNRFLVT